MKKIDVWWVVSKESGCVKFDVEDLGCESEEEWEKLSEEEKKEKIQEALDNANEQPYMVVNTFEE